MPARIKTEPGHDICRGTSPEKKCIQQNKLSSSVFIDLWIGRLSEPSWDVMDAWGNSWN